MPDDEPTDAVPRRPLSATEELWSRALSGQTRRVFKFGYSYLPHAMGLERLYQAAYKYDSEGALTDHAGYVRIATALAAEDGWLAAGWHPECAEIFMRSAELVIWFDDPRARWNHRERMRRQNPDFVTVAVQEAWRSWRRRRRGEIEDQAGLLDRVRSTRASAPDPLAPYVQMATSDFAGKLLRVTNDEQIAALNSVRPNRWA